MDCIVHDVAKSRTRLSEFHFTSLYDPAVLLFLVYNPTSPFWRRSARGVLWRVRCWSWNFSTLATSCEEWTLWKRLWCWEGLEAGGNGDDRGWEGWMSSLTQWTWVWVNSGSWWWTGRPGVLRFMGSRRVGHDWATELNWGFSESMSARKKVNDKDESRFLREGRGWNDKGRELEQNVKFKNEQEWLT